MPTRSLTDFRGAFIGSGARPNLFRVALPFPALSRPGAATNDIVFMAQAASIPSDKLGEIEIPYMGRKTYYPGDREFDTWTLTVLCDESFDVRDAFENWSSALNSHEGNVRDPAAASPPSYLADIRFEQLSKIDSASALKVYLMTGAFPTELGAMEADYGTMNTIHKFQVTLRYQWWTTNGPNGPTTDGTIPPLTA